MQDQSRENVPMHYNYCPTVHSKELLITEHWRRRLGKQQLFQSVDFKILADKYATLIKHEGYRSAAWIVSTARDQTDVTKNLIT